jgi:Domain of unknown function (DUF397)
MMSGFICVHCYQRVGGWVAREAPPGGQVAWRKARRSVNNGACVEVASLKGNVLVRDSKIPDGSVIGFSAYAWRSFLSVTKAR